MPAAPRIKGGLDLAQTLAAVPVVNRAVRCETRGDALVLFVPLRRRWWMNGPVSWWLPLRREKGVALDRLGREVWESCDGRRDLKAVIEAFADRYRLGFHEARLTVMRFMQMLVERKLIVLVGTADATGGSERGAA
ncbi:MAG: PqqD family protein [Planctomycetota bacterium]